MPESTVISSIPLDPTPTGSLTSDSKQSSRVHEKERDLEPVENHRSELGSLEGAVELCAGDTVILGRIVVTVRSIRDGKVTLEFSDGLPLDGVDLAPHPHVT